MTLACEPSNLPRIVNAVRTKVGTESAEHKVPLRVDRTRLVVGHAGVRFQVGRAKL